jgi:hypothetical protein
MSTKRQQAMIAAKSAAPVKRRAEISFDEFYDTYLDELTAMYTAAKDGLESLGLFREKKRSFVDFVDWCYAQYSSFEIVSDSDEDDECDDEDEEEEEEEDEDESETDESELDSDELGSDDPSSFDGESADDDDEDDAEETAE